MTERSNGQFRTRGEWQKFNEKELRMNQRRPASKGRMQCSEQKMSLKSMAH